MIKRKMALVADDVELNRDILSDILEDEYDVLPAVNGVEALKLATEHKNELAVILLDLVMPEMDGFEVLEELKKRNWVEKIPVLVISGEWTPDIEHRCFDLGIVDYVRKPFNETLVKCRVGNAAELYEYKNRLEEQVAEQTKQLMEQNKKLQAMNESIIELMGDMVEARNLESGEHVRRVKGFTRILAEDLMINCPKYGLDAHMVDVIVSSSALHDVGKIMIPDSVLLKPGKLTDEEFALMKTHSARGCEIIGQASGFYDPEHYRTSREICRHHHEKYDGRGYPDGLKGDEIPIAAQLVSVADCYDALVTERVYKRAFTPERAYQMIINGECGAFSDDLHDCLTRCKAKMEALAVTKKEG